MVDIFVNGIEWDPMGNIGSRYVQVGWRKDTNMVTTLRSWDLGTEFVRRAYPNGIWHQDAASSKRARIFHQLKWGFIYIYI